jgi:predicted flap endonuclease-1-like 5' DNA nuclease
MWPWILPFLTGIGLGWVIWGHYKSEVKSLENKVSALESRNISTENELVKWQKSQQEKEKEYEQLKNQLRICMDTKAGDSIKLKRPESSDAQNSVTESTESSPNVMLGNTQKKKWSAAIGHDRLQIIEGIGPKMEQVLKENNIQNFRDLALSSPGQLRTLLNKYGEKYRIIDPETWPQQASFASEQKWDELMVFQSSLGSEKGKKDSGDNSDSKLYAWLTKAKVIQKWVRDDLKAIEGIGPKIEKVLHDAGITSWEILAKTPENDIRNILLAGGSRFSLADPGSWARQADLADKGLWDDLEDYQNLLNAGKEK